MIPRALSHRLPAHIINGIAVALGVGLIQVLMTALGGRAAALGALTGAICSSLADVPLTPGRTWRRVLLAGILATVVTLLVHACRPYPAVMGPLVGGVAFASMMALAWGPRAGPVSFVGILAFIFTMAAPPPETLTEALAETAWTVFGAALYFGWSLAASKVLQPRYRTLALAAALAATAGLLRSRARLYEEAPRSGDGSTELQDWIENEARLDERLQLARDLLLEKQGDDRARHQAGLLLLTIDLRDTLLASELDTELLGHDSAGERVRRVLATTLLSYALSIDGIEDAVRSGGKLRERKGEPGMLGTLAGDQVFEGKDPRARLLVALLDRGHRLQDDLAQMLALMRGGPVYMPLRQAELKLFISAEGWPLSALKRHATMRSPVLRHALRMGVALFAAYFIGEALPWASHPVWLILSVAVVLRGNLEQTLSRRNARVAGTILGCLLVLGLSRLGSGWATATTFLFAVGVAHSFATQRYLVTSIAATVMALLQAHLAFPEEGFAVFERLADTFLGALLAWGFSYVLPSWEKRALPGVITRVRKALAQLATEVLRWPDPAGSELQLRLARREVYEALGAVAATAQRTGVEPSRVRLPLTTLAALLRNSHALLGHLASLRGTLARRGDDLNRAETELALQLAAAEMTQSLDTERKREIPAAEAAPEDAPALPKEVGSNALLPWVHRRLKLAEQAADRVAETADTLTAVANAGAQR
ncbi:MAG TPA: FUSC family membrane protein [Burkholderiales bacterium]|nr:FUSC family membrane protein [Burkholderiales bacterium]